MYKRPHKIPRSSLSHLGTKNIPTDQIHRQTVCGSGHPRHAQGQKADGPKKTEEALENVSRFDRAIMPHVYSRLNMKGKQRSSIYIYIYIHVYTVIASHYNAVTCEHSVGLHPTLSMHKLCCC